MNSSTPLTEPNQLTLANQKYQKAIKEINKLMSINRSTKKQLITLQEQYDILRQENDHIKQKYSSLQVEHNRLLQQQEVPKIGRPTQSFGSGSQILENLGQKHLSLTQNRRKQSLSPALSIPNKQLQNTGSISQYIDNKRRIEQYEQKLMQKDEKIKEMMKQIMDKNKQNTQLYQKQISLIDQNAILNNEQQLKNYQTQQLELLQHQTAALQKELQKSQQSVRQLTDSIAELKKAPSTTLIHLKQSFDSNMTNTKSLNIIPEMMNIEIKNRPPAVPFHPSFYSAQQSSRNDEKQKLDPFSEYYFKKVRDLENELKKVRKIMQEKDNTHKQQILALKTDIKQKKNNMLKMNSLLTKQQEYIEEYIHARQPHSLSHQSPSHSAINPPLPKLKLNSRNPIEGPTIHERGHRNIPSILQGTRINTIQSQQYTVSLSEVHKANYGLNGNSEGKVQFMEGNKYYNK